MLPPEARSQLIADLTRDESIRLKPYIDTKGKITIGVGRNLTDNGIRPDESALMLSNDIDAVCGDLDRAYPWWTNLSPPRQRVLANMCFNLGLNRLSGFTNMFHAIRREDWNTAAAEMLDSEWAKEVGARATRLADLMREG